MSSLTGAESVERSASASIASPSPSQRQNAQQRGVPMGAIIGGTIGGALVLVILLVAIIVPMQRRRRSEKEIQIRQRTNLDSPYGSLEDGGGGSAASVAGKGYIGHRPTDSDLVGMVPLLTAKQAEGMSAPTSFRTVSQPPTPPSSHLSLSTFINEQFTAEGDFNLYAQDDEPSPSPIPPPLPVSPPSPRVDSSISSATAQTTSTPDPNRPSNTGLTGMRSERYLNRSASQTRNLLDTSPAPFIPHLPSSSLPYAGLSRTISDAGSDDSMSMYSQMSMSRSNTLMGSMRKASETGTTGTLTPPVPLAAITERLAQYGEDTRLRADSTGRSQSQEQDNGIGISGGSIRTLPTPPRSSPVPTPALEGSSASVAPSLTLPTELDPEVPVPFAEERLDADEKPAVGRMDTIAVAHLLKSRAKHRPGINIEPLPYRPKDSDDTDDAFGASSSRSSSVSHIERKGSIKPVSEEDNPQENFEARFPSKKAGNGREEENTGASVFANQERREQEAESYGEIVRVPAGRSNSRRRSMPIARPEGPRQGRPARRLSDSVAGQAVVLPPPPQRHGNLRGRGRGGTAYRPTPLVALPELPDSATSGSFQFHTQFADSDLVRHSGYGQWRGDYGQGKQIDQQQDSADASQSLLSSSGSPLLPPIPSSPSLYPLTGAFGLSQSPSSRSPATPTHQYSFAELEQARTYLRHTTPLNIDGRKERAKSGF